MPRYCPKCCSTNIYSTTNGCNCGQVVNESRRTSSRTYWRSDVPAANTTDDGEEVTDPFQNVEEVYIDYTDFIRVVKMRLEAMEVGGGTLFLLLLLLLLLLMLLSLLYIYFFYLQQTNRKFSRTRSLSFAPMPIVK